MTRDEIIKMAREAKIECDLIDEDEGQIWYITTETLERLFHAAYTAGAAAEREANCKINGRLNQASHGLEAPYPVGVCRIDWVPPTL